MMNKADVMARYEQGNRVILELVYDVAYEKGRADTLEEVKGWIKEAKETAATPDQVDSQLKRIEAESQ